MVHERSRKHRVRARMSVTGEPFTLAARGLEQRDMSYLRDSWLHSGWQRLLPAVAHELERVLSTATLTGLSGSLPELMAELTLHDRWLPDGLGTPLTWGREAADEETRTLAAEARAAFEYAMRQAGWDMPATVGELAEVLAAVGVYQRTGRGARQRWIAPVETPDLQVVLSLPPEWLEREDRARWSSLTCMPAVNLGHWLNAGERPDRIETTIEKLAAGWGHAPEQVRLALDGLLWREWLQVLRFSEPMSRPAVRAAPAHARITLVPDWSALADDEDVDDNDAEDDPQRVIWSASPWKVYCSITTGAEADLAEAADLLAMLPFTKRTPDGHTSLTWLRQMSDGYGVSLPALVEILFDLEKARYLRWNHDEQIAEITDIAFPQ